MTSYRILILWKAIPTPISIQMMAIQFQFSSHWVKPIPIQELVLATKSPSGAELTPALDYCCVFQTCSSTSSVRTSMVFTCGPGSLSIVSPSYMVTCLPRCVHSAAVRLVASVISMEIRRSGLCVYFLVLLFYKIFSV